ncbi:hypothetical protein KY311_01670 [Candidatus Woesearchaeota archaeon]|nr:hypothetical protein [Candidatus Woesearchaeota archaeon]MBW3016930.1 hypothetical protein [Candidatus Woesearchaeota archaeon]
MGKSRLRKEAGHMVLEIILILASVLIFRSAWLLLDSIPGLSTFSALVIMLVIGIGVSIISFDLLFKHEPVH